MKVCLIFFIAFCIHNGSSAKKDEVEDITPIVLDFLSHVPFSKLLRATKKYSQDPEVQNAILFLRSDEFKDTWEDVAESLNIQDDFDNYMKTFQLYMMKKMMNMQRNNHGGVKALMADLNKAVSWNNVKRSIAMSDATIESYKLLYTDLTSGELKTLFQATLRSEPMQDIVKMIKEKWQFDLIHTFIALEELIDDIFTVCDGHCTSSEKPHDHEELDKLDDAALIALLKIYLTYCEDGEVQNRLAEIVVFLKDEKFLKLLADLHDKGGLLDVMEYVAHAAELFHERQLTERAVSLDLGGVKAMLNEISELTPWDEIKQMTNKILKIDYYKQLEKYLSELQEFFESEKVKIALAEFQEKWENFSEVDQTPKEQSQND
ncbi:uncharacterized protein LOC143920771 [Arctopsyche grandis]|uniref:uncharacterized protein LOC143920771 n=1 Tax=Arctopsyche grandis TaxID=121162 RepID=UPI00406D88E9